MPVHAASKDDPAIALTLVFGAALAGLVVWITILQQEQGAHHVRAGTIAGEDTAPAGPPPDAAPPR
jgi:hypothetical protein